MSDEALMHLIAAEAKTLRKARRLEKRTLDFIALTVDAAIRNGQEVNITEVCRIADIQKPTLYSRLSDGALELRRTARSTAR